MPSNERKLEIAKSIIFKDFSKLERPPYKDIDVMENDYQYHLRFFPLLFRKLNKNTLRHVFCELLFMMTDSLLRHMR